MKKLKKRRAALAATTITILLSSIIGSAVGATYLYSSNIFFDNNNNRPPVAKIASVVDGEVLPPGIIEVKGAAEDDSAIKSVSVSVDGGSAVPVTPNSLNDFTGWSVPLDLPPGNHTIEVETTDDNGIANSNKISVIVSDKVMNLPPDKTVEATGPLGAVVEYSLPSMKKDTRITHDPQCSPASGNMFPIGTTTVSCTVSFASGGIVTGDFKITVRDSTPPFIIAPPDLTIKNTAGQPSMILSIGEPKVKDAVDADPKVSNNAPASGFGPGTTIVAWTAADDSGNESTAKQKVLIIEDLSSNTTSSTYSAEAAGTTTYATSSGGGGGGGGSHKDPSGGMGTGRGGGNKHNENSTDTTAPTLTATPSGGTYGSSKSVALAANEQATIYYTLDGAVPTTASQVYSSPISIAVTTTLKFTGKDTAGNVSPVYTETYVIDTITPTVTATPAGGTFSSTRSITLTASEPATIYYTTNGNTPTTSSAIYSSAISISSSTTLKYFAKDTVGNIGNIATQVYTIDNTSPIVTAAPSGGTYTFAQSVILTGSEPATIYYTIDGSAPTTSSSLYSLPIGIASTTTLKYFAKDNAGNSGGVFTQTYTINAADTTLPLVAITSPTADSTVIATGGKIAVTGTSSDSGSGIKLVEVRVDSGSYIAATPKAAGDWSTWSVNLPITAGERRLVPRATDNAGNQAWNSINVTVSDSSSGGSITLDKFGIKKLYQTKSGGNEWFVNMNDPKSDTNFRNLPTMTRQSDGSWQVSASQVRMEAWSPENEKWLNVEITEYAKIIGGTNELLQMYSRGGHHTDSNQCLGSAYKGRLYGDGHTTFVKEITHPAYTSNRGSVQATTNPLEDRWVGFKTVIYNFVENGKTYVHLESFIDDDVTDSNGNLVIKNNWKLASVVEDKGGWSTTNSDFNPSCFPTNKDSTFQYRQRDEIHNLPGGTSTQNIAAWRSDDQTWNWKYLSVREIVPPS